MKQRSARGGIKMANCRMCGNFMPDQQTHFDGFFCSPECYRAYLGNNEEEEA